MNHLFRRPCPAFQHPCKRQILPQQGRWCKLAILPPLHILNETSSNLLEYLVLPSSTHVHNLARCSIVWNAKTPLLVIPRFVAKTFTALYDQRQKGLPRCARFRSYFFSFFSSTARFARRLFTQILQFSDLGG